MASNKQVRRYAHLQRQIKELRTLIDEAVRTATARRDANPRNTVRLRFWFTHYQISEIEKEMTAIEKQGPIVELVSRRTAIGPKNDPNKP